MITTAGGVVPCADEAAVDPVDKGEYAAMRSRLGTGLCPNPSRRGQDVAGDPKGLDDGEPPAVAFPDASPPTSAAVVEAELAMYTALATLGALEYTQRGADSSNGMYTSSPRRCAVHTRHNHHL